MKNNKFDIVTDEVKRRMSLAIGEARRRFKNTNPYRMEKVTDEDRIRDYQTLTPEKIAFAKQNFGENEVNAYLTKMQNLLAEKADGRKNI